MTKTTPAKSERQRKSPAERATEELETAERVRDRHAEKVAAAEMLLKTTKAAVANAQARVDYALLNPALPEEVRTEREDAHRMG